MASICTIRYFFCVFKIHKSFLFFSTLTLRSLALEENFNVFYLINGLKDNFYSNWKIHFSYEWIFCLFSGELCAVEINELILE